MKSAAIYIWVYKCDICYASPLSGSVHSFAHIAQLPVAAAAAATATVAATVVAVAKAALRSSLNLLELDLARNYFSYRIWIVNFAFSAKSLKCNSSHAAFTHSLCPTLCVSVTHCPSRCININICVNICVLLVVCLLKQTESATEARARAPIHYIDRIFVLFIRLLTLMYVVCLATLIALSHSRTQATCSGSKCRVAELPTATAFS